jgi:hypothetical protein
MRRAIRKSVKAVSSATGAGGIPVLDALNGDQAHACNVIGSDQYGDKGVVCADTYTYDDSFEAYGTTAVELFCENAAGAVVRCAGTQTTGEFTDVDATGRACGQVR